MLSLTHCSLDRPLHPGFKPSNLISSLTYQSLERKPPQQRTYEYSQSTLGSRSIIRCHRHVESSSIPLLPKKLLPLCLMGTSPNLTVDDSDAPVPKAFFSLPHPPLARPSLVAFREFTHTYPTPASSPSSSSSRPHLLNNVQHQTSAALGQPLPRPLASQHHHRAPPVRLPRPAIAANTTIRGPIHRRHRPRLVLGGYYVASRQTPAALSNPCTP